MKRRRDERGAIAVLVGVLVFVLVGILAFVADFGYAYANQRKLQNAVDAAVLAAGQRIVTGATNPSWTCDQLKTATTSAASSAAQTAFNQNAATGSTLTGGVNLTCTDSNWTNRIVVSASGTQQSQGLFGGLYGYSSYGLNKSAKVVVGPPGKVVGVRPFALCDPLAALQNTQPDGYLNLNFDNEDLGCGTATGNFGTLDIRYPPVGGSPGSLVDDWVRYGYDGSLPTTAPLTLNGSPGIPATNLADDFAAILDTSIVLPTYDVRSDNGSHSDYNITGFVEVKVCGVKLSSGSGSLATGSCFQSATAPSGNNDRFVQLQFVRFIPIGQLDLTCQIAAACDPGIKVSKLAQ
jgi:Flp pilus assembly protein TadG